MTKSVTEIWVDRFSAEKINLTRNPHKDPIIQKALIESNDSILEELKDSLRRKK